MMSLGQSASELQKGQSDTGSRVSTKKPASALSGGAMKPAISTGLQLSATSLSDISRPRTPEALYISSKRTVSLARGAGGHGRRANPAPAVIRKVLRHVALSGKP